MTFAIVIDVPGPVGLYDALHAEFLKYPMDEMLLHVARPVPDGVQITEVWTSAEAFQEWMGANAGQAMGAAAAAGWTVPEVAPVPFDPVGLIVPAAGVAA